MQDEAAGDNCAYGGQRFDVGLDLDDNGKLDDAEIDQTSYVCNGNPSASCQAGAMPLPVWSLAFFIGALRLVRRKQKRGV